MSAFPAIPASFDRPRGGEVDVLVVAGDDATPLQSALALAPVADLQQADALGLHLLAGVVGVEAHWRFDKPGKHRVAMYIQDRVQGQVVKVKREIDVQESAAQPPSEAPNEAPQAPAVPQ